MWKTRNATQGCPGTHTLPLHPQGRENRPTPAPSQGLHSSSPLSFNAGLSPSGGSFQSPWKRTLRQHLPLNRTSLANNHRLSPPRTRRLPKPVVSTCQCTQSLGFMLQPRELGLGRSPRWATFPPHLATSPPGLTRVWTGSFLNLSSPSTTSPSAAHVLASFVQRRLVLCNDERPELRDLATIKLRSLVFLLPSKGSQFP